MVLILKSVTAMACRRAIALFVALTAMAVAAQPTVDRDEWVQDEPPPPNYSTNNLIRIEMPPYVTLQVGVDPQTIQIHADGEMRYVVVMRNSSGTTSAAYEGIQCAKGEVKTYARVNSSGAWVNIGQPRWKSMNDNIGSRHAQAIAQQGGCEGNSGGKREDVINALKGRQKLYF
jgi:hypothetical protein